MKRSSSTLPATGATSGTNPRPPALLLSLALALATLIAFLPVLTCGFTNYDDPGYVTKNLVVQQGLTWYGIKCAFAYPFEQLWHPLTMISLMADYQLFGLRPAGYHLVNLLFHIANVLLLFGLLQRLTGCRWRSLLVAAFFGIHPLRVESVAWIVERKDVLCVFFALLALHAYAAYAHRPTWWRYGLIALMLLLSLLAKPMFVTLPFLLLLLDYWPLRRDGGRPTALLAKGEGIPGNGSSSEDEPLGTTSLGLEAPETHRQDADATRRWLRLAAEKFPLLAIGVAVILIQFAMVAPPKSGEVVPDSFEVDSYSLPQRLANAPIAYVRYIAKMIDVRHLAPHYPLPEWATWQVIASSLVLLSISAAVILLGRRHRHLPVGWFWFLGLHLPVIGIFAQVSDYSMADRYSYLTCVGLLILCIWSIPEEWFQVRWKRYYLAAIAAVALLFSGLATYRQCGYWRNSRTLFQHTVEVTSGNWRAQLNLGVAMVDDGDLEPAAAIFRDVLHARPNSHDTWFNLAQTQLRQGNSAEALDCFHHAAQLNPQDVASFFLAGYILDQQGHTEAAIAEYQQALRADATLADAWLRLGKALDKLGKNADAKECFQRALLLKPDEPQFQQALGTGPTNPPPNPTSH